MTRFGALEALRSRPVGDLAGARAARKGFRARIPIRRDNALFGEMMVEAREQGLKGENFYAGDRNPPYWHRVEGATDQLLLRRSVARKQSLIVHDKLTLNLATNQASKLCACDRSPSWHQASGCLPC